MLTLAMVVGFAICAVIFFLIPAMFGKGDPSSLEVSDSDGIRLTGAGESDRPAERKIESEHEIQHNPKPNANIIKKVIWIVAIAVAALVVYNIASPYQNCLAKSDKNWCAKYTDW